MAAENKVTFNKNVKFGESRYVKGGLLSVDQEVYSVLLDADVIEPLVNVEWAESEDDTVDLFTLSKEELEKINKAAIIAFLDKEEIEYNSKATKDELIELIVGE